MIPPKSNLNPTLIVSLEISVGGIQSLEKLPDALFVIDLKKEVIAVKEANKKGIPIIALCDTNVNPDMVQYPIPANDDALRSIELLVGAVVEVIKEGQAKAASSPKTEPQKQSSPKKEKPKQGVPKKEEQADKK